MTGVHYLLNKKTKMKKNELEPTPKSLKARHCEVRSNLIMLTICMLRLLHFVRNDEKPLFRADSN